MNAKIENPLFGGDSIFRPPEFGLFQVNRYWTPGLFSIGLGYGSK
jgi:hypothetical protein